MAQSLKDLIVVLAIAVVVFGLARPVAMQFMAEADFLRRRNIWLALTAVAFLSPSFWLFVGVAALLVTWVRRRDPNPVALYLLLLHVIPPIPIALPAIGVGELFDLDNYRLLSFCILIPVAWRARAAAPNGSIIGLQGMDYLLLAFGAVQVALFIPPDLPNHVILEDSATNILRRAFLFLVDAYALYFAVSRTCSDRAKLVEAMATFCLACAVMAAIATFENLRHWLLYANIEQVWSGGFGRFNPYLERGGTLRAQATAGHSLVLGYLLAIALGFWLYLQTYVASRRLRAAVVVVLWCGLIAAYSRGPWLGAVAIYLVFTAVRPGPFGRTFKSAALVAVAFAAITVSPLGERIRAVLPFLGGSVDERNVAYRERLAADSWQLILEHPWFGDQLAFLKLEDLRQGQGLIDLVNAYASIALFYGLVGLFLVVGFALLALARAYRAVRMVSANDPRLAALGASLVACIVGTLLMLVNCSLIYGYEKMFYILAAFAAAYSCFIHRPAVAAEVPQ